MAEKEEATKEQLTLGHWLAGFWMTIWAWMYFLAYVWSRVAEAPGKLRWFEKRDGLKYFVTRWLLGAEFLLFVVGPFVFHGLARALIIVAFFLVPFGYILWQLVEVFFDGASEDNQYDTTFNP